MVKSLTRRQLHGGSVYLVHGLRLQSSWWGKAWPQKRKVKGHLASAPVQCEEMSIQLTFPFLLFVRSAEPSLGQDPCSRTVFPLRSTLWERFTDTPREVSHW